MELSKELLEKAKAAKTAEELIAIAKENEVEMTEESAKAYFELMQAQTKIGELSDEELDNVAGGACHTDDGRMVTTVGNQCEHFVCKDCGLSGSILTMRGAVCSSQKNAAYCTNCKYMSYESGLWLCNHSANRE